MTADTVLREADLAGASGVRIAYRERLGTHTGAPALVFLHGGGMDHRMWESQLSAFPQHRVLAMDARGHGWTSAPTEAPYRHCDYVVGVLDALGIEQAVLVGLSQGGATAVDTLLEHPGRVLAVVACGAGTSEPEFRDPWALEVFAEWQRAAAAADPDAWIAASMRFLPGPHRTMQDVDEEVAARVSTMLRRTIFTHIVGPDGPVLPTPATPVTDTWQRLPHVAVPVLGVAGELDADDHIRMVEELADTVPGARKAVIPAAAHYPNLEQPSQFNTVLREFLTITS